jgi:basic amino acid/polyamine antiporter, APA family
MHPIPEKENLKREIGVRSLALAIINTTVGTGIFMLPALVAENLGAAAILAYLVCGALIFLIALCFAEVGSKVTTSGGTYAYIETAFGPFPGFIANNLFWFGSSMLSDAAIANALADTLKSSFPMLEGGAFRILFFVFVFGTLALINIRSVKHGVRFVEFATFAKLIPLLLLVMIGAGYTSADNFHWTAFPSITNIGSTSLLLFFAFLGIESPITNSGEIKDPKRTVPLGIFFGIASVLVLYTAIQLVTQGVLGATITTQKDSPLAGVAGIIFGRAGIVIMIFATAVSILGALGGEIMSIPRVLFAGARDGVMPKVFARVHPRFSTPHIAVIFYSGLGLLFATLGGFKQLAIISGAATLLIYLGVVLATIKLRKDESGAGGKSFKIPGGILVPLIAVVIICWLLYNLTQAEFTGIAVFILIFTVIYFASNYFKNNSINLGVKKKLE